MMFHESYNILAIEDDIAKTLPPPTHTHTLKKSPTKKKASSYIVKNILVLPRQLWSRKFTTVARRNPLLGGYYSAGMQSRYLASLLIFSYNMR